MPDKRSDAATIANALSREELIDLVRSKPIKTPAFQIYPNDWLGSDEILMMDPRAEGGYIRLLCHEWNNDDCGLPDVERKLAMLSRLGLEWKNHKDDILTCFVHHEDRYYNIRLCRERAKYILLRQSRSMGGLKSRHNMQNLAEVDKSFRSAQTQEFKRPTKKQMSEYCHENRIDIDIENFHNYYSRRGWMLNKDMPMVDWHAAVKMAMKWPENVVYAEREKKLRDIRAQEIARRKAEQLITLICSNDGCANKYDTPRGMDGTGENKTCPECSRKARRAARDHVQNLDRK